VIGPTKVSLPTNLGGVLLVEPLLLELFVLPAGGDFIQCPLPADESACGAELDLQILEFDPGASACVSFSQGLELIFGY
jgi:hypothetical protein